MKITHKIRTATSLAPFLSGFKKVACGIKSLSGHKEKLHELGFSAGLPEGSSILPEAGYGPSCRKNANGWIEIHRDRPMETYYTEIVWRWKEWRGREDYVDREEVRLRPGKRYPRTLHPPLGIEISIRLCADGSRAAVLEILEPTPSNYSRIVTAVNILIEVFGECDLLTEELDSIVKCEVKRLNWQLLPPGKRAWTSVKEQIKQILAGRKPGARKVIERRIEAINHYEPQFFAFGIHGFHGYIVIGFPDEDIYILESIYFGNATYVFSDQWEKLSMLSKSEILENDLHEERIIHDERWFKEIARLLS